MEAHWPTLWRRYKQSVCQGMTQGACSLKQDTQLKINLEMDNNNDFQPLSFMKMVMDGGKYQFGKHLNRTKLD